MAAINETFDVKIKIVFPFLTKSLPTDDSERINASGAFNYEGAPQVNTADGNRANLDIGKDDNPKEENKQLEEDFEDLIGKYDNILALIRKRAGYIVLEYDEELTENEALADAEAEIFGSATGEITYDKYQQALAYMAQLDKYIHHESIEKGGSFAVAS